MRYPAAVTGYGGMLICCVRHLKETITVGEQAPLPVDVVRASGNGKVRY